MPTDYVVLQFEDEDDLKAHIAGSGSASGERQAKKQHGDPQQISIAVPRRSFKPERRVEETKPVDRFENVQIDL